MRKLQAPDGYYYTQAAAVPAKERIFAKVVYLGKFDSPENWRLADEKEKEDTEREAKGGGDEPEK